MTKNELIQKAVLYVKTNIIPEKLIGYAVSGSALLNLDDQQSDIDISFITENLNQQQISSSLNIYDPETDCIVEILVEDIYNLFNYSLQDYYGYFSWINYIRCKSNPIIFDTAVAIKYEGLKNLIANYNQLWFMLMLIQHRESLIKVLSKLKTNSNISLTRKDVKETYHLCYAFCDLYSKECPVEIIKQLKRNALDSLSAEDKEKLKEILNTISLIEILSTDNLETQLEKFKQEARIVWM